MSIPQKIILLLSCFFVSFRINAQQLIKSIPVDNARSIFTDESGNVYLVKEDNGLCRFNQNGDSTGDFRSIQNGELQWIDATNPLRILLYYPAFSKVILLDRMLTIKNELSLKKLNLYNPPAVGMSADGKIWVYDFVNARLKKIDDQLNITQTGNDMRQESQTVPHPSALLEKDSRVYLCDSVNGIYTFDRFAGYINTLEIKGVKELQAFGPQLIYRIQDTLHAYDLKTLSLKSMLLPKDKDFIQARIERNRIYHLYKNRLEIFKIENSQ